MDKVYMVIESYYEGRWIPYSVILYKTHDMAMKGFNELINEALKETPGVSVEYYGSSVAEIGYFRFTVETVPVVDENYQLGTQMTIVLI